MLDASIVVALGAVIFTFIGVAGLGLADLFGMAHPSPGQMIGGTMLAGLLAMPLILVIGYYIAVLTSRFGLDPDNHAVPIITSVMDLTGVVASSSLCHYSG